ncbi:response regulator transcription factor [Desulfonauticus submarinus]
MQGKKTLLLIEDDEYLGLAVKKYLESKHYIVKWFKDGRNIDKINLKNINLVILDLMLPYVSGEKILSILKNSFYDLPIIILTAKNEISSKKECFDKGADDYLTKPFEILELELRIKSLLKRFSKSQIQGKKVWIDDICVDLETGQLFKQNKEIKISKKCWEILKILCLKRGELVAKEEIMKLVWDNVIVGEDTLRTYIKNLRKILPSNSIETYKGRGYKLK